MKSQLHLAFAALAAATVIAGCGGSGATIGPAPHGGATVTPTLPPGASPTPTPTATATLAPGQTPSPTPTPHTGTTPTPTATPTLAPGQTPSPTPTPTAVPTNALYHPGTNGDAFSMTGSMTVTYDRSNQYPTPEPTSTTNYTVTQSITVTNPSSFNGVSNAADFKIAETDQQLSPAQTFTESLNQYFQYTGDMYTGNFVNLGYTSLDDSNYSVTLMNGSGDGLVDILPEKSGASWTNNASKSISTNDGNGETSSQTIAANGSYNETITYQDYHPSPNPTGSQLTNQATIVANVDGSVDYQTPRLGTAVQYNYDYNIKAPTAAGTSGTISETTTIPPQTASTAGPTTSSTSIPNWMPTSVPAGSLYAETDVDNGPVALPTACAVPSAYATGANQIVQTKTSIDPLLGYEVTTTTTYDKANVGPVCIVVHDVQNVYYDFSGQNGTGYFSGTPQQITTIDETLYLSSETLNAHARRTDAASAVRAVNVSLAQARVSAARFASRERALHRGAGVRTTSSHAFRGAL